MPDTEGSVFVDGIDSDVDTELESEVQTEETSEKSETPEKEAESKEETEEKTEDAPLEKTDKGTNLDKDPLSAAHQLRANAEAKAKQYEQVLTDPNLFWQYAQQAGFKTQETKPEEKKPLFDPEKLETAEGVTEVISTLAEQVQSYKDEIEQLKTGVGQLNEVSEQERTVSSVKEQISLVQGKYPELNPRNKDKFDPELEERFGKLYQKLDFDPRTNMPQGRVSLTDLADEFMYFKSKGRQAGTLEAQTVVKDKTKGQVKAGGSKTEVDESSLSPGQVIAQRIAKIRK